MTSKDIVLLSTADWDNPFWTNKQHVANELAHQGHRVFYIDTPGLRRPTHGARDIGRMLRRLRIGLRPPRRVQRNIWVWSPIALPWHTSAIARRINRALLKIGVATFLAVYGLRREWLWTYHPLTTELLDVSSFQFCVYHCVDEIKAQPGTPVTLIAHAEETLARSVDVIFTTSRALTETRKTWNSKTYYLPNVADFSHFSRARDARTSVPPDLASIPRPRLGFVGAISEYKLDFSLIRKVAELRPQWSLVLIGLVGEGDPRTDISCLGDLPNLHLLGPRPYSALPGYMKGFDVALLPNRHNAYTTAMFPMKFFEYLAAGCPVVSVHLESLREFRDAMVTADSPEQFVSAIDRTLTGDCPELEVRIGLARRHTYEARTRQMLTIIDGISKP